MLTQNTFHAKEPVITFSGAVNLILNVGVLLALNTFTKQEISFSCSCSVTKGDVHFNLVVGNVLTTRPGSSENLHLKNNRSDDKISYTKLQY